MMLGIDSDRAAVISLSIGSALAGLAAVLILPLGNVTAEAGYRVLIYALAVCIIGGLGSWAGTILASFVLGFRDHYQYGPFRGLVGIGRARWSNHSYSNLQTLGPFRETEGTGGKSLIVNLNAKWPMSNDQ